MTVPRPKSARRRVALPRVRLWTLILALSVVRLAWGTQGALTDDIPLLDARFDFQSQGAQSYVTSPWNPSIVQAVGLGVAFYEVAFYGIDRGVDWLGQRGRSPASCSHEEFYLAKGVAGSRKHPTKKA